ncbi:NmrA family NAD(P)-binding protein [Streptomyces daliensis]|uniref:NmrA family NAD(P)-binding protein n=1 Tax=Streptomyces daliensis TaxID=299421 RepID=A0A8T4IVE8_9ACTN|nr:NmrA family NAD(P)-binding protein [Streptomyces daliensis]
MTASDPVLVTGGTGKTGSRVAAGLAALGHPVRAGSRRPSPGQPVDAPVDAPVDRSTDHPVRPVRFDWADPATHGPALDGTRLLYLVAPLADPDPAAVMLPFLRRARESGVRRAVLLSSSAITETGDGLSTVHRAVRDTFPEWAVLRPSWFMDNFTGDHPHAHSIRAADEIVTATGEGRVGFVDVRDIAEVGVRALSDARAHNTAHLITGPEALSYADVAAVVSRVTGRRIAHRPVPYEAMRDRLAATGMPPAFAALLAGMDRSVAGGSEDRVSPTVERVTGRPPRSFAEHAAAHAGDLARG